MHFKLSKKIFFVLLLLPIIWSLCTKNPAGTSIESNYETISSLEFLYDLTYQKQQKSVKEQSILSAELDIIEKAEDFIVLDLFLYNDVYDKTQYQYPNTTQRITEALIAKKEENPDIDIIFITDPINGFYGSYIEKNMQLMKEYNIIVIETNFLFRCTIFKFTKERKKRGNINQIRVFLSARRQNYGMDEKS